MEVSRRAQFPRGAEQRSQLLTSLCAVPALLRPIRKVVRLAIVLPAGVLALVSDVADSNLVLESPQIAPAVVVLRRKASLGFKLLSQVL